MDTFSESLKSWRQARRFSQLDLALEAEVSSRHISFLETGRARPSREMIGKLGEALQLPLDAQNQLLYHAGFAPRYTARSWDNVAMAPIRQAIMHTLSQHAPYPAIAVDRLWSIVRMNDPARMLYGQFGLAEGSSLLDLMLSDFLPPLIENWPAVAHHSARRLRTESAAQGGVPELEAAAMHLSKVPAPQGFETGPVVPTILKTGTMRLSMFATIAQFGTPEDITLDALKIELFFPADSETDALLRAMASAGG
ncbi:MAG: helix-turn-helix transcriptional regulator [Yoonia sp.]|uniref:helix-turn-helix domain-containing protein n=1 Tax=Yoonia sp. TaxID=2212373 RepID=UPI00273EB061|nr:helix-turn-helix transcriptional regulator [Yoonia sp.]MDP5086278.1 helix-turn-helix transcriptional regulator [Yoonia sp.]MDP5360820.1 helix-turn-helix transcriptional regulator [Paracoccaceae bacterium]